MKNLFVIFTYEKSTSIFILIIFYGCQDQKNIYKFKHPQPQMLKSSEKLAVILLELLSLIKILLSALKNP